jgi:deoxyribonuclease-4
MQEKKVLLSVHAPYYINLNSEEKPKRAASEQRIFESAHIGSIAGAQKIVFHAGFFLKKSPKETFETIAQSIEEILEKMKREKVNAVLAPELTGKPTQFGSLQELLKLTERVNGIELTIDFSHLHARTNGSLKIKKDFDKVLQETKNFNSKLLEHLHMHVSGMNYSPKGERNHLNLQDKENDFDYKLLLQSLHDFNVSGTIICESPNLEQDALLMKKYFSSL